jgi:hypothetical protein
MFSLPDINAMNNYAASDKGRRKIAARGQPRAAQPEAPLRVLRESQRASHPVVRHLFPGRKGVFHVCRACADYGRHHEEYFECDSCCRLMVTHYTWELYYRDTEEGRVCLTCAARRHFGNPDNLVSVSQIQAVTLRPDGGSPLFDEATGELNISRAPHVLAVRQPVPDGVEFVENWEFDSLSGRQISGGDMLAELKGVGGGVFIVCDAVYQFAVSIAAYRPVKSKSPAITKVR